MYGRVPDLTTDPSFHLRLGQEAQGQTLLPEKHHGSATVLGKGVPGWFLMAQSADLPICHLVAPQKVLFKSLQYEAVGSE